MNPPRFHKPGVHLPNHPRDYWHLHGNREAGPPPRVFGPEASNNPIALGTILSHLPWRYTIYVCCVYVIWETLDFSQTGRGEIRATHKRWLSKTANLVFIVFFFRGQQDIKLLSAAVFNWEVKFKCTGGVVKWKEKEIHTAGETEENITVITLKEAAR